MGSEAWEMSGSLRIPCQGTIAGCFLLVISVHDQASKIG